MRASEDLRLSRRDGRICPKALAFAPRRHVAQNHKGGGAPVPALAHIELVADR